MSRLSKEVTECSSTEEHVIRIYEMAFAKNGLSIAHPIYLQHGDEADDCPKSFVVCILPFQNTVADSKYL